MDSERVIDSKRIFDGRVVHLRVEIIEREDGTRFEREIIQHGGAVAMLPFDADGNVILVRQYRAGRSGLLLEMPAGGLEPGEEREDCARRELQEEIGYYPEKLTFLGGFYVAASYTTEYITIYACHGLRPSRLKGDMDEDIEIVRMPFAEAMQMVRANEIEDSKTLIGLNWAAHKLGLED
jgi:ADP-ribose pyrophosphatase